MKKYLATLLMGLVLTVAALPAAAQESGNTVTMTANADGAAVSLALPKETAQGVKALRLSFAVESTDPIDAQFDFDSALPGSVQQCRYDPATGRMNVYVAGGSDLFPDGTASLGNIRLDAPEGSTATVRLVEDSLELVNGAFGKTQAPSAGAVSVDVTVGGDTPTQTPTQTPAPETTQPPTGDTQNGSQNQTSGGQANQSNPASNPTPTPAVTTTPVSTAAPSGTVPQSATQGSTGGKKPTGGSQSAASAKATPEPSQEPQASTSPVPSEAPQAPAHTATPEQTQAESAPAMNPLLVVLIVVACLAAAVLIGLAVIRFRSR